MPVPEHAKVDPTGFVSSGARLIGRAEDLKVLTKLLEDTIKGEGGTVLIEGEAGVGKTRLVQEFENEVKTRHLEMLVGNCLEGGTPYLPFLNAMSGLLDKAMAKHVTGIKEAFIIHQDGRLMVHRSTEDVSGVDDDVMSSTLTAIRDFIEHSFRPSEDGELKEVLFGKYKIVMEEGEQVYVAAVVDPAFAKDLRPQLRRVIQDFDEGWGPLLVNWKGELSAELTSSVKLLDDLIEGIYIHGGPETGLNTSDRGRLFEKITGMVSEISKKRPLVLFFDDLQWMDSSSLDLLHYISRIAVEETIMIVGAYRPEDLVDNATLDHTHDLVQTIRKLSRERLFTLIRLKRLEQEGTRDMVNSIFPGNEFAYSLPDRIFNESKGNPLFIEEVLREFIDSGIIFEKEGVWENAKIEEIKIPSSIKDVVMRRLGRLGDKKTEILQYASVVGNEFSYDVLEKALSWSEADTIEELDDLVKLRVLNESLGEDRYNFDHEILREVLYESMSRLARRRIHEKVGNAIMDLHSDNLEAVCFDLANQFANTRNRELIIKFNLMAGEKAQRTGATAEAVKYLEVTLANIEPDVKTDERARHIQLHVFYDLGLCHSILGNRDLALSFMGKALDEGKAMDDQEMVAKSTLKVADEYRMMNEWGQAMANYQEVAPIFEKMGNAKGLGLAHRGMGQVFWRQGEFEMAIEHLNVSVDIFSRVGMDDALGSILLDLGNVYKTKGEPVQAEEKYNQSLKILMEVGDKYELARLHNNVGTFYMDITGKLDKAQMHYSKSLEIAKESNDARALGYALSGLGYLSLKRKELDKAEDYLEQAHRIFERIDDNYMLGAVLNHKGMLAWERGDHNKAIRHLKRSLKIYEEKNLRYNLTDVMMDLGMLYIEMGRMEEAEDVLTRSLTMAEEIGAMDRISAILEAMEKMR